MTERVDNEQELAKKFENRPAIAVVAVLLLLALIVLILFDRLYPHGLGPRQPIPFSHRVHVHVKKISCLMCHTQVTDSARAGIPPLQTCILCHDRIIRTFPYIQDLRRHYDQGKPIVWERVNWVPEFVYFNHSVHVQRGIDCGRCHGNVAMMDRVVAAHEFQMGFCIQCHRDSHATHDCFTCHR
ncbi:cytochrome c3 family protein [Geobacter sp. DSM 9736]|uniref:cytochrome c3 family protein n=1 Tax=Geobacter sp. DSM 9736 TaxID=1277350 RepID=UPI000B4FEAE6|nr:cytochrome c3 family protein [Geobacter sp. DSM 9736]SNB46687.1 quinol:cytochrome c oxidoreductase pentaheme cytochrome subunit [Geobacter sp. DSM 9736]